MEKPCDKCTTNLRQAAFKDEIDCFKNCKDFDRWQLTVTRPVGLCPQSDRADTCVFDDCSLFNKCFA